MKTQSVLLLQTPLLKTVLTTKTPVEAAQLLKTGMIWHDDLKPILDYIRDALNNGKKTFNYQYHLQKGSTWAKDIEDAYTYPESDFEEALADAVQTSQKEALRERLLKLSQSENIIEDFKSSQLNLATLSSHKGSLSTSEMAQMARQQREQLKGKEGQLLGASTGFKMLNDTTRGFQGGQFWILGGATSGGKTWISLQMMLSAINDSDMKGTYITMELSATEIFNRAVAQSGGFSLIQCKTDPKIEDKVEEVYNFLIKKNNFFVNDNLRTVDDVVDTISRDHLINGSNFFVVDYLQNLTDPKKSEYEILNEACLKLQTLARTKNLCIMAVTQFNRESVKARKKDKKSLFQSKGSGNIENSADFFIQIEDATSDDNKVITKMALIKNRLYGEKADTDLEINLEKARYVEWDAVKELTTPVETEKLQQAVQEELISI